MIVVPRATALAVLTDQVATGNILDGAIVMLYKSPIVLDTDTLLADLDEADFDGYVRSPAIVWSAPFMNPPDQHPTILGDLKTFVADDPLTTANTIYGYAVLVAAGTSILWAENFEVPITIGNPGDTVAVLPQTQAFSQAASG